MGLRRPLPSTSQLSASGKENQPRRKARRSISISALFNHDKRPRSSSNTRRGILASRSTGITKSQRSRSKPVEDTLIHREFAHATKAYRHGVACYKAEQIEPIYHELLDRINGVNLSSKPHVESSSTLQCEVNTLAHEEAKLSLPLAEETIKTKSTAKDGSVTLLDVKLGDTMQSFKRLLEHKRTHLLGLFDQLESVDAEIVAAKNDIFAAEEGEVREVRLQMEKDFSKLLQKAGRLRAATLADVDKAREEDRIATVNYQRKVDDFMNDGA